MESRAQGYADDRFIGAVDQNFSCPICMNVLKDPVQCQRNEHHFCKPCITRHLQENAQTCPVCIEKLTLETLVKPPRIVLDYLSGLKITCDYAQRGCQEVVELGVLESHVARCGYAPIVCSKGKCKALVNKMDLEHHQNTACGLRTVQCDDCNKEMSYVKYQKHGCCLSKEVDKIKLDLLEMKENMVRVNDTQKEILKQIKALTTGRTVLPNTKHTTSTRDSIVVLGGDKFDDDVGHTEPLNSVERFGLDTKIWTLLSPMQYGRSAATSACYKNQIIIAGGKIIKNATNHAEVTNSMEQMFFNQKPTKWLEFPTKLPYKCWGHKSVIHGNSLLVIGGRNNKGVVSDAVHQVSLEFPHTSRFKSRIPYPISHHGMEHFDEEILIFGGTPTGYCAGCTDRVLIYNIQNNRCEHLPPLPFPLCNMATVKCGDEVIIIGGATRSEDVVNTMFKYNYQTKKYKMLPPMKKKRGGAAAVISGNRIFVMGGYCGNEALDSVECFNVNDQSWEDLPSMSKKRKWPTAVAVSF